MASFAVLVAVGCHHDEKRPEPAPNQPVTIIPPDEVGPTTHKSTGTVTVYRLARTAEERKAADENGLVPVTMRIPIDSKAPARDAIAHLIDADGSPIPDGTELTKIKIDDDTGLATLDFSSQFVSNFKGGDKVEAQIINSIRATLGQFSNVRDVRILVAGKKISQLGGTIDLSDPLPVIRTTGSAPAPEKGAGPV
ncbi:MAG: GerMN domain-containing protein [Capsulimonadaceae bacterium]|nr:GerMN domain-containing protein [Capsulimonadaceae bacterium]